MGTSRKRRPHCSSPFRVTARQLLSFLAVASTFSAYTSAASEVNVQLPLIPPPLDADRSPTHRESFHLRSILHHGTFKHPGLLKKLDVRPTTEVWLEDRNVGYRPLRDSGLSVSSTSMNIQRMKDRSPTSMYSLMSQGRHRGAPLDVPATAWTVDAIKGPNVTDKETVLSLARIASNAYVLEEGTDEWENVGGGFNYTNDFGWEGDGLRGHIFADEKNRTVVIGLKGTSPAVFDGAETTTNDKINDNLFFSCCCGQGGSVLWHQVCNCKTSTYTCNSTCLVNSLRKEDRYYYAARQLYGNVTAIYPDAEVWVVGHSLGGAVSSLLGMTYGLPVVSFEAPGDAMAANRLGLPTPPGYGVGSNDPSVSRGIYHFGHTGDPVFTGNCGSCTLAGYAMESVCHTGMVCRYDTVKDKGFHSYIGNHKIVSVIHDVLEVYDEPAECEEVRDCYDCFNWKYFKSNGSELTTTSSSSSPSATSYTQTRTETCQTPGWFGCLDETTSSTPSTTTPITTTTSSTSTCETPGWFGCLDPITSTTTMTLTSTISTSTCLTPGWFGCHDETTKTTVTTSTTTTTSTSTCNTPGYFGCKDPITTTTSTSTTAAETCETPGWFWCKDKTTQALSMARKTMKPTATPAPRLPLTTPTAKPSKLQSSKWFGFGRDTSTTTYEICQDKL